MNKTVMILVAVIGIAVSSYWIITSQSKNEDNSETIKEVVGEVDDNNLNVVDSIDLDTSTTDEVAKKTTITEAEVPEKPEAKVVTAKEKTPPTKKKKLTKNTTNRPKEVTPITPVKKKTPQPPIVKKETPSPKVTPKKTTTKPITVPKTESKPKPAVPKKEVPVIKFSHNDWDKLLRKYVSANGNVNYAGFKKDKTALKSYLKLLSDNPPKSSDSRNKKLAYWINAYNAFTIDLIVENYPIKSILKLDGGKTWYVKRITIGGKKYSLSGIEKNILIGRFKEARIHFAINCAAKSCPPIMNRAWTAQNLNNNLDQATRNFINNQKFNQIKKKSAKLSPIFDWYQADFGNVIQFINQYSATKMSTKAKLQYIDYNWDLNK